MAERQQISPHPLDGCDEDDCYKTMMAERAVLVTAQREAQDNLIKTVVQLSSALIALSAGFVTQTKFKIEGISFIIFILALLLFALTIIFGLSENFYSSKDYKEQQSSLEEYYGKYSTTYADAPSNVIVRRTQVLAFLCFVVALLCLGLFAIIEVKGTSDVKQSSPAATSSATASSSTTTTTTTTTTVSTDQRGNVRQRSADEIGGADNAAASSEETITKARPSRLYDGPGIHRGYCCIVNACAPTFSALPKVGPLSARRHRSFNVHGRRRGRIDQCNAQP